MRKEKSWQAVSNPSTKVQDLKPGEGVVFADSKGMVHRGSIRIKEVLCGKKACTKCPHKIYAYARYRVGKKVTEKYLGVARR